MISYSYVFLGHKFDTLSRSIWILYYLVWPNCRNIKYKLCITTHESKTKKKRSTNNQTFLWNTLFIDFKQMIIMLESCAERFVSNQLIWQKEKKTGIYSHIHVYRYTCSIRRAVAAATVATQRPCGFISVARARAWNERGTAMVRQSGQRCGGQWRRHHIYYMSIILLLGWAAVDANRLGRFNVQCMPKWNSIHLHLKWHLEHTKWYLVAEPVGRPTEHCCDGCFQIEWVAFSFIHNSSKKGSKPIVQRV